MRRAGLALATAAAIIAGFAIDPGDAEAHAFRVELLEVVERAAAPGVFDVTWTRGRADAEVSLVFTGDRAPDAACTPVGSTSGFDQSRPSRAQPGSARAVQRWTLDCGGLVEITASGLGASGGAIYTRVRLADGHSRAATLHGDAPVLRVAGPDRGAGAIAWAYLRLGVEHIVGGFDHALFVAVLLLLIGWRGRRFLATVTAFTVAHSLTLGLAATGWVGVPGPPIEALIALSIAWVAADVIRGRPSELTRRPWRAAFAFGLLHGFGFAGALAEIGLGEDTVLALACFNAGVELGQLAIVAVAFAGAALVRVVAARLAQLTSPTAATARSLWSDRARHALAYAAGGAAMYWTIERFAAMIHGGLA